MGLFFASRIPRAAPPPPCPRPAAAEDTDENTLDVIQTVCAEVFDAPPPNAMFGEMARRIRVELDKRLDSRGWSVVVGRAFGAYLTHKIQSFCYLSVVPGVTILVWKA